MKLGLFAAITPIAFMLASAGAIARADDSTVPQPASPAHMLVSFTVGASTVARITPAAPSHVSYCAVDSRGNMTCGAPVTMGKVSKVEHK